jgi:hypothetical protein
MVEFITAGGPGMWSVIAIGILTLVAAGFYVAKGEARRLAVIRALSWATLFATLTSVASDLEHVMYHAPNIPDLPRSEVPYVVMQGIGESLAPAVLGFAILGLTWLLVALGARRHRQEV